MSNEATPEKATTETAPPSCAPSNGSAWRRENIWNGWTNNYRSAEDGYVTHACIEIRNQHLVPICGSGEIQETGMLTLADGWQPGCIKCRNKLKKLGLLTPNDQAQRPGHRDVGQT